MKYLDQCGLKGSLAGEAHTDSRLASSACVRCGWRGRRERRGFLKSGNLMLQETKKKKRRAATAPPADRGRDARQSEEETGLTVESR